MQRLIDLRKQDLLVGADGFNRKLMPEARGRKKMLINARAAKESFFFLCKLSNFSHIL